MKELPDDFTDAQHAAWIRYHDKKEKRNEVIASIIVYGGISAVLLYCYFTAEESYKEKMFWLLIGGAAYYDICNRIDRLRDLIRNQKR